MDNSNFKSLMAGQLANWADVNSNDELKKLLSSDDVDKQYKRQMIRANAKPIPGEINSTIQKYIEECRSKKIKNRTIRRMVMRKFNITVI